MNNLIKVTAALFSISLLMQHPASGQELLSSPAVPGKRDNPCPTYDASDPSSIADPALCGHWKIQAGATRALISSLPLSTTYRICRDFNSDDRTAQIAIVVDSQRIPIAHYAHEGEMQVEVHSAILQPKSCMEVSGKRVSLEVLSGSETSGKETFFGTFEPIEKSDLSDIFQGELIAKELMGRAAVYPVPNLEGSFPIFSVQQTRWFRFCLGQSNKENFHMVTIDGELQHELSREADKLVAAPFILSHGSCLDTIGSRLVISRTATSGSLNSDIFLTLGYRTRNED